jgi:phosphatidylinositol glycan class C protein
MSDGTVIVQHLASVVVFCCCFVAIIQGRVSPVAVVVWASLCSVLAWALWDYWMGLSHSSDKDASDTYAGSRSTRRRLTTVKSAALIYAALLGLSPILKSLTKSTTSDSIWALSTWLLFINVAFFDYSGGPGTQ